MIIDMNGQSAGLVTARPARLPLWLADQVEEHMLEGDYLVDAQLPTESALAARYGVSRQVVREAARLLEDRGLVNIRPGRGMTVAAPGVYSDGLTTTVQPAPSAPPSFQPTSSTG